MSETERQAHQHEAKMAARFNVIAAPSRSDGAIGRVQRHSAASSADSRREKAELTRRSAAEALGSALLVAIVVGSGIMGERLAGGNVAIALLANAIATGCGLSVLILVLGPVSGAHFNPAVTLSFAVRGKIEWGAGLLYVLAQVVGALSGAVLAHAMFEEPLIAASTYARSGFAQCLGEFVATFGLLLTIFGCLRSRPQAAPYAIGLFIVAGYWFTSSTSFANPAVTIARAMTDTFAGIRPLDVPAFILAQLAGALAATLLSSWLLRRPSRGAAEVSTAPTALASDRSRQPF